MINADVIMPNPKPRRVHPKPRRVQPERQPESDPDCDEAFGDGTAMTGVVLLLASAALVFRRAWRTGPPSPETG